MKVSLSMDRRRKVTLCNHNFSVEGIYHPDRIMEEYDLLFLQDGQWEIIEDDHVFCLKAGDVLLLEPGKHHYSEKKCSPMMRNIYVHFENDSLDKTKEGNRLEIMKHTRCEDHSEIRHSFERIVDAFWSVDEESRFLRSSLLLENLLLQLSDIGSRTDSKADVLVSEIIHRFHCEPERFLSPEELALSYNVSVRTISGRFKKETGLSIHQYQLQTKLDMAYDLLPISPGRSLHDIALSFGFYDEFQFSKLFKRRYGIAPSKRR